MGKKARVVKAPSYSRLVNYFDHNASSPLCAEARAAWLEASEKFIGNPSSPHRLGQRADAALEAAREELAAALGCDAFDIVWTSGATESAGMALHHLARTLDDRAEVWVSAIEHPCVLAAARERFADRAVLIPAMRDGRLDLDWVRERARTKRPAALLAMAANNETGVLQPWAELRDWCREASVTFFCDAVQWLGRLPARGLGGCDFVSGSAHKFGGPRGVGFLKCPAGARINPLLTGGGQERGRRAGTENVAGVLAMLAALQARKHSLTADAQRERTEWRTEFETALVRELPGAEIVGADVQRLWNTVSALMPEADCQRRWVVKLDRLGFAVSTGSACSSGNEEPSHVLTAMGRSTAEAGRVLRFSAGWETTRADWQALLGALREIHAALAVGEAAR